VNVLQVITPSRVSGAERSTAALCEGLAAAGHRVVIACKRDSPFVEFAAERGLDVRPLGISGKLNVLAAGRIARLAREIEADVVHAQLSTAAWQSSLARPLMDAPVVAHVRALNRAAAFRLADRVIAISRAVKQHLVEQGMESERIHVVYTGIDPERYRPTLSREAARERLDIAPERRVIGVVAHLTRKKGHHVFLEALALVAQRAPDVQAILVGEGEDEPALRALTAALGLAGRVTFAGYQGDVLPYYAAMDVLALPSIGGEGLPRVLLEAGLAERAVVATALSGAPEIVRDGETGYLAPPGDAAALAERLVALLEDEERRRRFGERARAWIAATFTPARMVEETLAVYHRAGARGSRARGGDPVE